jgi:16S rRNA (cytidine1402-2'-O)-methyltransferase
MPLYVVATPIGNLQDITLRALRTLQEADLIAAEDTRAARVLLRAHGITTPATSFHEHSPSERARELARRAAQGSVAFITDAGTPGLSDPGYALVSACVAEGAAVIPIPGPSALAAAWSVAAIGGNTFTFAGFLPKADRARESELRRLAAEGRAFVVYESPRRAAETLAAIAKIAGDRQVVVCRELTKIHEEIWRGTAAEAASFFAAPRGEFVIVVAPVGEETADVASAVAAARALVAEGEAPSKAAAKAARAAGVARAEVYAALVAREGGNA